MISPQKNIIGKNFNKHWPFNSKQGYRGFLWTGKGRISYKYVIFSVTRQYYYLIRVVYEEIKMVKC